MFGKNILGQRLLMLVAVCAAFCISAISSSQASVCLIIEGGEDCQGDPGHYSSNYDSDYYSSGTVSCETPPCERNFNCQAKGFEDSGNGNEWDEYGTFSDGGRKYSINIQAAKNASDWPNEYRVSGHNDSEHAECVICHRGAEVIEERDQSNRPVYYFRCNRHSVCGDGYYTFVDSMIDSTSSPNKDAAREKVDFDISSLKDGRTVESIRSSLQEVCSALDYDNTEDGARIEHIFTLGSSYNNNYVCGRCEEKAESKCANGTPRSKGKPKNKPESCFQECQVTGEKVYTSSATIEDCCHYPEVTECSGDECVRGNIAEFDPTKPSNTGCTGWTWNDENANYDNASPACSCVEKPCADGSEVIDDEVPAGPNAQGYYWIKKGGKCYAKQFTNWHGNAACYAEVEMSQEEGSPFKCAEGSEFDTNNCECMPLACPEGWSMYAHSVDADGNITNENVETFLFGNEGTLTAEAAAANCGVSGVKGWTVQTTEDGTPEGRTFISAVRDEYGTTLHQCGKCVKKPCGEVTRQIYYPGCSDGTEKIQAKTEAECNVDKEVIQKVDNMFSGDDQCYYCPYCFFDDETQNECRENFAEGKLRPCVGEGIYPPEDEAGVKVCNCDDTLYYSKCVATVQKGFCEYTIFGRPIEDAQKGCLRGRIQNVVQGTYNPYIKFLEDGTPALQDQPLSGHAEYHAYRNAPVIDLAASGDNFQSKQGWYVVSPICPLDTEQFENNQMGVSIAKCTANEVCYGEAPAKGMVTCYGTDRESDNPDEPLYTEGPADSVRDRAGHVVTCGAIKYYRPEDCNGRCLLNEEDRQYACTNEGTSGDYISSGYSTVAPDVALEKYGRGPHSTNQGALPYHWGGYGYDMDTQDGFYVVALSCSKDEYNYRYVIHQCTGDGYYNDVDCNGQTPPAMGMQECNGFAGIGTPVYCGGKEYYTSCESSCDDFLNDHPDYEIVPDNTAPGCEGPLECESYYGKTQYAKRGTCKKRMCYVNETPNSVNPPALDCEQYRGYWYCPNDITFNCLHAQSCTGGTLDTSQAQAKGCEQHDGYWYCPNEDDLTCWVWWSCYSNEIFKETETEILDRGCLKQNDAYYKCPKDVYLTCINLQCDGQMPEDTSYCDRIVDNKCYAEYGYYVTCPEDTTCKNISGCKLITVASGVTPIANARVESIEYTEQFGDYYYVKACDTDPQKWYISSCARGVTDCAGHNKENVMNNAVMNCVKAVAPSSTPATTPYTCAGETYAQRCSLECGDGCFTEELCRKLVNALQRKENGMTILYGGIESDSVGQMFNPQRGKCIVEINGVKHYYKLTNDYGSIWNDLDGTDGLGISDCQTKGWCLE